MHGLETLHMTPSVLRRMDTFHLRGLRQILKFTTTFVDRTHTREFVYAAATAAVRRRANGQDAPARPPARPMSELHTEMRCKLLGHLLRAGEDDHDPLRASAFLGTAGPALLDTKRAGRPRQHWTLETLHMIWPAMCRTWDREVEDRPNGNEVQTQRDINEAAMLHCFGGVRRTRHPSPGAEHGQGAPPGAAGGERLDRGAALARGRCGGKKVQHCQFSILNLWFLEKGR